MITRAVLVRRIASEALGTALLLATVVGSGIMAERNWLKANRETAARNPLTVIVGAERPVVDQYAEFVSRRRPPQRERHGKRDGFDEFADVDAAVSRRIIADTARRNVDNAEISTLHAQDAPEMPVEVLPPGSACAAKRRAAAPRARDTAPRYALGLSSRTTRGSARGTAAGSNRRHGDIDARGIGRDQDDGSSDR